MIEKRGALENIFRGTGGGTLLRKPANSLKLTEGFEKQDESLRWAREYTKLMTGKTCRCPVGCAEQALKPTEVWLGADDGHEAESLTCASFVRALQLDTPFPVT